MSSSFQHKNKQQQLNDRLKEIKKYLKQIIECIKPSKGNGCLLLSNAFPQIKFQKSQEIEKQNKIMAYELHLLSHLLEKLQIDENNQLYILNKQEVDEKIKLYENNKKLIWKNQQQQEQIRKMTKKQSQINLNLQKMQRKVKIYEKKYEQYQKLGGITTFNSLKQTVKKLEFKNNSLSKQIESMKIEVKKQKNRSKILEQLNKQTELMVADKMMKQTNLRSGSKQKSYLKDKQSSSYTVDKQNCQNANNRVQLLSAKQQIRSLKAKIEELQKQKSIQKAKHQQKQIIYEKMMSKKLRY